MFQTPPLPQDLEIAGPIEVKLWVATDGPDADIHAKLVDLYPPSGDWPDGFAMNLCEGLLRLRYRDSWEAPTLLEPGRVYSVVVAMFPCANLFRRGHRLRLDLEAAISRISTSIQIRASRRIDGAQTARDDANLCRPPTCRTWCCRSSAREA